MLDIDVHQRISMIRGDTGIFDVELINADGTPYELADGDTLTFTVKKSPNDRTPLLIKHGKRIKIDPADTGNLSFGRYVYDIQLTFQNGYVDTVVPMNQFNLLQEVTWDPYPSSTPVTEEYVDYILKGRVASVGRMCGTLTIPKTLSGTDDYSSLRNKPTIENVELVGNKDFEDLGLRETTNQEILDLFK